MHELNAFEYAVIRIVPFTEREEFFNAGVILYCPQQRFLQARIQLDAHKLAALGPSLDEAEVQQRLESVVKICDADPAAGPMASMSQSARFHWLAAPRSTLIQVSSVHSGICSAPLSTLDRLFTEQVPTRPLRS